MVPINSLPSVARPRPERVAPPARALSTAGPLAGRRILAVHDSPEITSALADVFAAAGARVSAAHDGPEANVLIAWGGYDLVFLDATAPGAADVLELIRECRPNLLPRTIVLTGDLRDGHATSRLHASYPTALLCNSWLVDLLAVAARAVDASERRAAA